MSTIHIARPLDLNSFGRMSNQSPSNRYQCPRCLIPRCVVQLSTGEWRCTNADGSMYECGFRTRDEQDLQRQLREKLEKTASEQSSHKHCCIACALNERDDEYVAKLEERVQTLEYENIQLRQRLETQTAVHQPQQKRPIQKRPSALTMRPVSRGSSGRLYHAVDAEAEEDTIEARTSRRNPTQSSTAMKMTEMGRSVSMPAKISSADENKEDILPVSVHVPATDANISIRTEDSSPSQSPDGSMLTPRIRHTRGRSRGGSDVAVLSSKFCADPLGFLSRALMANPQLSLALDGIGDWDFDIFAFERMGLVEHHPMLTLGHALLTRHGLIDKFGLDQRKVLNWLTRIESGYSENPYHNNLHGADVMLSSSFWFDLESFASVYDDFDRLIMMLAGAAHDVGHTGMNNKYHRAIESNLAMVYNDKSVLENYHVSFAFQIMKKYPECDWMSDLDHDLRVRARNMMVNVILGTDMEKHSEHVEQMKTIAGKHQRTDSSVPVLTELSDEDRMNFLVNAFHLGDIGNSCKNNELCVEWANRVVEEFRQQGDAERRNKWVSDKIFDRSTPIETIQIGWIKFVLLPYSQLFADLCPELHFMVDNLRTNLDHWNSI